MDITIQGFQSKIVIQALFRQPVMYAAYNDRLHSLQNTDLDDMHGYDKAWL